MVQIIYNDIHGKSKLINYNDKDGELEDLYRNLANNENIPIDSFKLYLNGKVLTKVKTITDNLKNGPIVPITMHHLLIGGKGGFGSMLRAIGAQIEKTTNKEACRDLSGRRLRDINAEKRFKEWVSKKGQDDEEKERKRKEKLEKMKQTPKIMFEDPNYFKNKDEIPQEVDEALKYGLKNAAQASEKRKETFDKDVAVKKQKKNLWLGVDLSESDEDSTDEKSAEEESKKDSTSDSEKDETSSSATFSSHPSSSSSGNSQQSTDLDQVVPTASKQISTVSI